MLNATLGPCFKNKERRKPNASKLGFPRQEGPADAIAIARSLALSLARCTQLLIFLFFCQHLRCAAILCLRE